MSLRDATFHDADILTEIAFKSKALWDYPEAYFDVWRAELTITPGYIQRNIVRVYQAGDLPIAFYSLVHLTSPFEVAKITIPAGLWLDHMFIQPDFIGKGIGAQMFTDAIAQCGWMRADRIKILSDPHARGFYEKQGCCYIADYPSTIPGRTTPYLECIIGEDGPQ